MFSVHFLYAGLAVGRRSGSVQASFAPNFQGRSLQTQRGCVAKKRCKISLVRRWAVQG
ncbi:hypothetical protein [Campylobacter sp.]|uniref:hypothetical protein n=1 Tax=Campylobacter sp. TaxID=205 RepID=UPI002A75F3CC|nr:hypothetical protein [Campylobacter sp.]MDY3246211.1 hypothetical protein [Campylobacter sp.]